APHKNNGDGIGRSLGGKSTWRARRHDDIRLEANQLGCQICEAIVVPLRPSILDGDVLALNMAEFTELLTECVEDLALQGWCGVAEVTDPRSHSRLLRTRRERPHYSRTAECSQQFPPSDGDCDTPLPYEVRKGNDTTPRACSLPVPGGQDAGCFHLCR